jgi:threonine/homoserine/homoserine lactone efflux protein
MLPHLSFLVTAFFLGLSGGLSPGPLLTLVVTESLRHGVKEGIKVSIAPLFTDFPIVLVTIYILSRLSDIQPVIGAISLLGAAFLIFLGCGYRCGSDQTPIRKKGNRCQFFKSESLSVLVVDRSSHSIKSF